MTTRYHVPLGDRRTTVSLAPTLIALLALKLGQAPHQPSAHALIRQWLQQQLNDSSNPGRCRVSQWLQEQVVFAIVDKPLAERYTQWLLDKAPLNFYL